MSVHEFRERAFVGSRIPSARHLQKLIHIGDLPGERLGGRWYVHVDDAGEPIREAAEQPRTGNPAADAMLQNYLQKTAKG